MERTPAKTRKNKRELDGTPDTPQTPCTPSSDSDIMSPPPVKRTKSRRELCPLMEQQHNKPDNRQTPSHHQHHYIQHTDENACGVDENKFGESQYRPPRPMPASPMLSRVLRNTENLQSPVKNPSYHGFDMDGIKPLPEMDDRVFMPSAAAEILPTSQDALHLSTPEPGMILSMTSHRNIPLNNVQLALPPHQLLEDDHDHVPEVTWHCPDLPVKLEDSLCPNLPVKVEDSLSIESTLVPVDFSEDKKFANAYLPTKYLPTVVLSLPGTQEPSPDIDEDNLKQPQADDSSPQSEKSPESEEWRMRQPKKRWLREVLRLEQGKVEGPSMPLIEVNGQAQPQSPVVTKAGETKEKWMGAMALIQLAEVPDEGSQPLNLSTARYTML